MRVRAEHSVPVERREGAGVKGRMSCPPSVVPMAHIISAIPDSGSLIP